VATFLGDGKKGVEDGRSRATANGWPAGATSCSSPIRTTTRSGVDLKTGAVSSLKIIERGKSRFLFGDFYNRGL
jgi:hypothetical protein